MREGKKRPFILVILSVGMNGRFYKISVYDPMDIGPVLELPGKEAYRPPVE